MTYADRSDTQLVALSHRGVAPAFAVLVHRHGPTILGLAAHDEDPIGATVATFVRAMRTLPDASEDVAGWLLDLAALELDLDPASASASDTGSSDQGDTTAPNAEVSAEGAASVTETLDPRLDEVWAELDRRWPDGKLRRHVPSWALWLGTTVVLLALAVLLPWAVLGSIDPHESVDELRASPLPDAGESEEDEQDAEEDEEDAEEFEEEPLPSFDFPEPPDQQTNSASSGSPASGERTEPTQAAAPTPAPTDEAPADTGPSDEQSGDDTGDASTTDASDGEAGDEPAPGDAGNTDPPASDGDGTAGGDDGGATPDDGSGTGNGGTPGDPGTTDDVATDGAGPAETDASASLQSDTTEAVDPDATSPDGAGPGTRAV